MIIRATIQNHGNASSTGTVEFLVDGCPLISQELNLRPGKENTLTAIWTATEGNHTVTVRVNMAGDSEPGNNEMERRISVVGGAPGKKESEDKFPVLYLGILTFAAAVMVGGAVVYRRRPEVR